MEHELRIEGMHCGGCATSLEQFLGAEPGVRAASVDHETGRGHLTLADGADVAPLLAALERMGYEATRLD